MKPEIKKKWLDALRSGEYSQTKSTLCDSLGYCCLGVLLDVSDLDGDWDGAEYVMKAETWDGERRFDGELGSFGRKHFGIGSEVETELVHMNDDMGKNFSEIADYIEKVL